MGQRGALPQPDNVRELRGNPGKRKPLPTPKAVPAIPNPPSWIPKEAKAEWKRVTPELSRLGILAQIDRGVLTAYCCTWDKFVTASRTIGADVVQDARQQRGEVKHPAWQIYKDSATLMASLAKELGLSPNARMRMLAPKPEWGDDSDLD